MIASSNRQPTTGNRQPTTDIAIRVEGLSKQYQLGAQPMGDATLRDTLVATAQRWLRPGSVATQEMFWALRDVSFEIARGAVVGVIGHNGAGKSTLLKLLARITEPTRGWAEIHGRVGSLLEVGTGFHPELSGRENIFLNGAILGMRHDEILRKFDEIVAFAEVEKFIDTPVKHYSSGMYLRLAFAVAAHLELDILMVDEVLAVGDAAFQKKCLGKMHDVTQQGRTVLFVSHNMQAIQSLSQQTLHLKGGRIHAFGDTPTVVANYLAGLEDRGCEQVWSLETAPGNDDLRLLRMTVSDEDGSRSGVFQSSKALTIEMHFDLRKPATALCVGFDLTTAFGEVVLRSYQTDAPPALHLPQRTGENTWRCTIPRGLLNCGTFQIAPRISLHNQQWIVQQDAALQFKILLDHGTSPFWNGLHERSRPGVIAPILRWEASTHHSAIRQDSQDFQDEQDKTETTII
jgi:lipopolysaccharide transport system ATP-binding protein